MIQIRHLKKDFGNVMPLKDVCCDIEKGEVISIIGPSGTGKSTLLRCINKLETPTDGDIIIDGVNICSKKTDIYTIRQKMGMVFQSFNLFAHLMIIENIMLGPTELLGVSRKEAYDDGMRLLESVGLSEKALSYPDELSGGQKQRAAIARTLAMHPDIILFDEPTSALDPTMVGEVLSVIRQLADQGLTMLIVTHEMKFAHDVSTRIFYMDEGIIYEDGTPHQIFEEPLKEKTRIFVRRLKNFDYIVKTKRFDFPAVNSQIELFGRRQLLSQRMVYSLQLVFEEICLNTIIQHLQEPFELNFNAQYSDRDGRTDVKVTYGGDEYDPFKNADEISLKLISSVSDMYVHEYVNGLNSVRLSL